MELTKKDTNMTKGLAIVFMVLLHLFCRVDNLPYECLKIREVPLVYYLGLFSDCCVAIYCFCSGYALELINEKFKNAKDYYKNRVKSVFSFLINYWIVLIVFSIIGLIFDKSGAIPGSLKDFLLHFFLLSTNYNGAWWFVFTYILLVFLSRPICQIINKLHPVFVNIITLGLYLVAYIQRFNELIHFNIPVLDWITNQLALLGTSLLPFVWGMYFYKYKLFSKLREFIFKHFKNWQVALFSLIIVFVMIFGHGIFQSLIVAPFTGIVTIVLFNVVNKGKYINAVFNFFGNHSTNIWLTHMFFYSALFKDFVFVARYPIFIFLLMMVITVCCSYVIKFVYNPISKMIK